MSPVVLWVALVDLRSHAAEAAIANAGMTGASQFASTRECSECHTK